MSRPRVSRAATTRKEDLLRAAAAIFAESGYERATVAQITARARVATGTFYLYFSSKESCYLGLVGKLYEIVLDRVVEARQGAPDVLGKVEASILAVLQAFADERDLATIVLVHGGAAPLQSELRSVEQNLASLLAQDFREAQEASLIKEGDAALRAHLVVGAMREALLYRLRHAAEAAAQDSEVKDFLMRALH